MAAACRYREVLDNIEARVQRAYRGREPSALIPRMTPSAELDALLSPATRRATRLACCGAMHACTGIPAGLADAPRLTVQQHAHVL